MELKKIKRVFSKKYNFHSLNNSNFKVININPIDPFLAAQIIQTLKDEINKSPLYLLCHYEKTTFKVVGNQKTLGAIAMFLNGELNSYFPQEELYHYKRRAEDYFFPTTQLDINSFDSQEAKDFTQLAELLTF